MAITGLQAESAPVTPDASIMDALSSYREARATYNALPHSNVEGQDYTPAELAEWARMDAAEAEIRHRIATTPKGVEAKLWLALMHTQALKDDDDAAAAGDLAYFQAKESDLEWNERLILSAIASLRAMQAN